MSSSTPLHDAPVGIFDSGLGGLSILRHVRAQLPHEHLLYVADTGFAPYGDKPEHVVAERSLAVARFLVERGAKAIVVACNTATAHALPILREELDVPVIGVVEPGARAAVRATRTGHIGVIGTTGTIRSQAYVRAIHAENPDVRVTALACPLFVPLVEEGWTNHEATHVVAEEYLAPFVKDPIDTLVLGCTHYPLLTGVIAYVCGDEVTLVSSAEETGKDAHQDDGKVTFVKLLGIEGARALEAELLGFAVAALEPLGRKADALRALAEFVRVRRR